MQVVLINISIKKVSGYGTCSKVLCSSDCRGHWNSRPPGRSGTFKPSLILLSGKAVTRRNVMPYILGWFMGVPVFVLLILFLIFH